MNLHQTCHYLQYLVYLYNYLSIIYISVMCGLNMFGVFINFLRLSEVYELNFYYINIRYYRLILNKLIIIEYKD